MAHRIGIIGLGTVGSRFVEQFNLHDDFDLVAAWDPDPLACAAQRDHVTIASDAAAVIEAADAVYIAVPPLHHRGYVEACVRARRAIFCEKPLGVDVAESRELVELVDESGLAAGINFVFSAAPAARSLIEAVEAGRLGTVIRADLRLHFAEWPRAWHAQAQWLRFRDQGGWIREVASHFLFVVSRALGPLRLDHGRVTFADGPDGELSEIDASARFLSRSGAPLLLAGTSDGVGPDVVDLTVRGSARSMRVWDWYQLQESSGDDWQELSGTDRGRLGAQAYAAQLDELSKLLDGEESLIASFHEALEVQELVEELLTRGR